MERNLTCIVCPMGCSLKAQISSDGITVTGNTCKRGEIYAKNECTNPQRTVTSTVKCSDGGVLPVKTDKTIPKEKMGECMKIINSDVAHLPVSIGDVIIEDVFGTNIVATADRK